MYGSIAVEVAEYVHAWCSKIQHSQPLFLGKCFPRKAATYVMKRWTVNNKQEDVPSQTKWPFFVMTRESTTPFDPNKRSCCGLFIKRVGGEWEQSITILLSSPYVWHTIHILQCDAVHCIIYYIFDVRNLNGRSHIKYNINAHILCWSSVLIKYSKFDGEHWFRSWDCGH